MKLTTVDGWGGSLAALTVLAGAAFPAPGASVRAKAADTAAAAPAVFSVSSPAFEDGGAIPREFTCQGIDVSPPLVWRGAPGKTRALALIVDDPDAPDPRAPKMIWVHWVLYDIPPGTSGLPRAAGSAGLPSGAPAGEGVSVPKGTRAARNDFGKTAWGGPCPPIGRHRYYFKLYAPDAPLGNLGARAGKRDVEKATEGQVLDSTRPGVTYENPLPRYKPVSSRAC